LKAAPFVYLQTNGWQQNHCAYPNAGER